MKETAVDISALNPHSYSFYSETIPAVWEFAKALYYGDITLDDLKTGLGNEFIKPFEYVIDNYNHVFKGDPTKKEAYDYGYFAGNAVQTLIGAGSLGAGLAAKLASKAPKLFKLLTKVSGQAANTTRVGQWMSKVEYDNFVKTGEIPRTNVLTKGKEGYVKQADKGDYYVEFDVDSSLLMTKDTELGWSLVKSKNQTQLKLAEKKGQTLPDPIGSKIGKRIC